MSTSGDFPGKKTIEMRFPRSLFCSNHRATAWSSEASATHMCLQQPCACWARPGRVEMCLGELEQGRYFAINHDKSRALHSLARNSSAGKIDCAGNLL